MKINRDGNAAARIIRCLTFTLNYFSGNMISVCGFDDSVSPSGYYIRAINWLYKA